MLALAAASLFPLAGNIAAKDGDPDNRAGTGNTAPRLEPKRMDEKALAALSDLDFFRYVAWVKTQPTITQLDTIVINDAASFEKQFGIANMGAFDRQLNIIHTPFYFVDMNGDFNGNGKSYDPNELRVIFDAYNKEAAIARCHEEGHADIYKRTDYAGLTFEEKQKAAVIDELTRLVLHMMRRGAILKETGLVTEAFPVHSIQFANKNDINPALLGEPFFWRKKDAETERLKKLICEKFPSARAYFLFLFNHGDNDYGEIDAIVRATLETIGTKKMMEFYSKETVADYVRLQLVLGYFFQKNYVPGQKVVSFREFVQYAWNIGGINVQDSVSAETNGMIEKYIANVLNNENLQKEIADMKQGMGAMINFGNCFILTLNPNPLAQNDGNGR